MNDKTIELIIALFLSVFGISGFVYFWWRMSGEQINPQFFIREKNPDIEKKMGIGCLRIVVLLIIVLGALFAVAKRHPEIADLLRKHDGKTGEELKAEGK